MTLDELTQQVEAKIPDKFFFQIAEVCELTQLPKSVLRFWESEFTALKPDRTNSGRRMYRRKDVVLLFKIKYLLYESKFTIDGARKFLDTRNKQNQQLELPEAEKPPVPTVAVDELDFIRQELLAIRELLS